MNEEEKKEESPRGPDRRKTHIDPEDLPFPDRRQKDRRVYSDEERAEILKRIKEDADTE